MCFLKNKNRQFPIPCIITKQFEWEIDLIEGTNPNHVNDKDWQRAGHGFLEKTGQEQRQLLHGQTRREKPEPKDDGRRLVHQHGQSYK